MRNETLPRSRRTALAVGTVLLCAGAAAVEIAAPNDQSQKPKTYTTLVQAGVGKAWNELIDQLNEHSNRSVEDVYPDLKPISHLARGEAPGSLPHLNREIILNQRNQEDKTPLSPRVSFSYDYNQMQPLNWRSKDFEYPAIIGIEVVISHYSGYETAMGGLLAGQGVEMALDSTFAAECYLSELGLGRFRGLEALAVADAVTRQGRDRMAISDPTFPQVLEFFAAIRCGALTYQLCQDFLPKDKKAQLPVIGQYFLPANLYARERLGLVEDHFSVWRWPDDKLPAPGIDHYLAFQRFVKAWNNT